MDMVLNESFKAFVRESFPDKSEAVVKIFQEVVNDRATTQKIGLEDLKKQAINDVRNEFVTKDFLKAEIAEVRAEIAEVKQELQAQIADVAIELQKTKVDILKWVFGMQIATITIILAGMKFMF